MKRRLFEDIHDGFRDLVRSYIDRTVRPNADQWDEQQYVSEEGWLEAGRQGMLGFSVPEELGGAGIVDYRFNAIVSEEFWRAGVPGAGMGFALHNDIVLPYLLELADDTQAKRWLPGVVTGETRTAIAMTEPGTGSDLSGIRTAAVRRGDVYVVNGAKTFISNGQTAGLIVLVARTGPDPHKGLSLLVVEGSPEGFTRGRNLDKIGLHSQDTSELSFADVEVPVDNLLGEEGAAFRYLMGNLPQERLCIAVSAVAGAQAAFDWTREYTRDRQVFGRPLSSFQNTRFELADVAIQLQAAQVLVDRCIEEHNNGTLTAADAAAAKAYTSELQNQVVPRCLQLFGGYGFCTEYPIARAFGDARVQTIYGGTTEIMKEIVARDIGL